MPRLYAASWLSAQHDRPHDHQQQEYGNYAFRISRLSDTFLFSEPEKEPNRHLEPLLACGDLSGLSRDSTSTALYDLPLVIYLAKT